MPVTFENKGYIVLKKQSGTAYEAPTLTDAYIPLVDAALPNPDYGIESYGTPADGLFSPAVFASGKLMGTAGFGALFGDYDNTNDRIPHGLLLEMLGFTPSTTVGTDDTYTWTKEGNCSLISALAGNLGCGSGTSGYGIQLSNSKMSGSFGAANVGSLVRFDGEVQGVYEAYGSQTAVKGNSPANLFSQPFDKFINNVISMDGAAWKITTWNQDMGITITPLQDPSETSGIGQMYAVNFEPRLTLTAQLLEGADNIESNIISDIAYSSLSIDSTFYTYSWDNLNFAASPTTESDNGIITRSMEFTHDSIQIVAKNATA